MIQTPISFGELLDKITILDIKITFMSNQESLKNVLSEYADLTAILIKSGIAKNEHFDHYIDSLSEINTKIWHLEDKIRALMANPTTDKEFIDTAVYIHQSNDKRAAIKKQINLAWGSGIVEEKSYKE